MAIYNAAPQCEPMVDKKVCDADRVLTQLTEAVAQANELAEYAASRLSQIMPQEAPCALVDGGKVPAQPFSPLFAEYRVRINDIVSSMERVRRMLQKIEV